jgi:energy-coupling factor transport system substrate-specific component
MSSSAETFNGMKVQDLVLISILSASITAGKLALSFVPNVEVVSLLFIVYTVALGVKRTWLIAVIFATTEIFLYGFSTWVLGYYVVWPMLILATGFLKGKIKSEYGFATISGIFGISFGFLFALFESLFYGIAYGMAYWVRGIPLDIIHGASNYILAIILFKPLVKVFKSQLKQYYIR